MPVAEMNCRNNEEDNSTEARSTAFEGKTHSLSAGLPLVNRS